MAVSHKGAISFGLVHIPVALYTATQDNDIHFNQLHKEDQARIRYKKVCAQCGQEVGTADIVKGYEYEKDQYVILSEADFEAIKTEKDRTLQILHFTDLAQIQPVYFEKSYQVIPEAGGEKAFALLQRAMLEENKVAVAKTVMGNKETLLAIMATPQGLLIETLYYAGEIKGLPKEYQRPELNEAELVMAKQLITALDQPFQPEQYHDAYQERLRGLIQDKINGQETVSASTEAPVNIVDLMTALQQSVQQAQQKPQQSGKAIG